MSRPPPRSPLFPYTTLFRSQATEAGSERVLVVLASKGDTFWATYLQRDQAGGGGRWVIDERQKPGLVTSEAFSLDRKSTRLNSSHVRISYAVFCLKKKKK